MDYYRLSKKEVLSLLKSGVNGLSSAEAKKRLKEYGLNEIKREKEISPLQIFLSQFKDIFVMILIFALFISFIFGEVADAISILIIVVANAIIGFFQEYKAEKSIEALKKYMSLKSKVIRDGEIVEIDSKYLVPGDIVILEEGSKVPADGRLLKAIELRVNEAVITGESRPVLKRDEKINKNVSVPERYNFVYSGSYVVSGRGIFVVTATGKETEIGRIAKLTESIKEAEPPLKQKLNKFAKKLAVAIIVIVAVIFGVDVLRAILTQGLTIGRILNLFMVSVALAVSAVPEGLPAVVTVALSIGAREMAERNALIRRLASVETLGSVDYLCVDKTGTLTKGEMTIRKIYVNDKILDVSGVGYEPKGDITYSGKSYRDDELRLLILAGALCNNSKLKYENKEWSILGDPTEGALRVLAKKVGIDYNYRRVEEFPFSSERKMMSTVNIVGKKKYMFTKGAVEVVLEKCRWYQKNGIKRLLTDSVREKILEENEKMASNALRVLAIAYKDVEDGTKEDNLIFLGLVGMIDPPREETKEAYKKCAQAGIKTVMITGDHKTTAIAVAKEIGIYKGGMVLTGEELSKMSYEDLKKVVEKVDIFARVLPEHKLKIVKALKELGHIVGMTGDGVNDAPALKQADIGIAVGSGTDVAKEASDMILLDDNYSTIVAAIEKGREVYENIRKFSFFLIRSNFDEIAVIGTFSFLGMPLPLTAPMILWENIMTDGAPALALAVDPPADDLMKMPPRNKDEGILHGREGQILVSFITQYFGSTLLFLYALAKFGDISVARTMVFTQATLRELFVVWNCRSEKKGFFRVNPLNNPYLFGAFVISILGTLAVVYLPQMNTLFNTTPLDLNEFLISLGMASIGLLIVPELFYGKRPITGTIEKLMRKIKH